MAYISETSPYAYIATFAFFMSACSSDLLGIRLSLTCGFLCLVLAALSGQSSDGSFSYIPLRDEGEINIPMFVQMILFVLNAFICLRLIGDERPRRKLDDKEMALFRFFQARCGVTPLQFDYILQHGTFVQLPPRTQVPDTRTTLYLVLEGRVQCRAKKQGNFFRGQGFVKRSGEFFDVKLFNLFQLPVGFDDVTEFVAKTETAVQLFAWKVDGLVAMRDLKSPTLVPFWHVMVLRAVAGVAIRHHLGSNDTLYDARLLPEAPAWLDGAPSRDFAAPPGSGGTTTFASACCQQVRQQLQVLRRSLGHIIPPHGVRHQPSVLGANNAKHAYMELVIRTHAQSTETKEFRFLSSAVTRSSSNPSTSNYSNHHDVETGEDG